MLRKIIRIQVKPSNVTLDLTLVDITIKHPLGVVEDVVVEADETLFPSNFMTMEIQRNNRLQQEYHCYIRSESTNYNNLLRGSGQTLASICQIHGVLTKQEENKG